MLRLTNLTDGAVTRFQLPFSGSLEMAKAIAKAQKEVTFNSLFRDYRIAEVIRNIITQLFFQPPLSGSQSPTTFREQDVLQNVFFQLPLSGSLEDFYKFIRDLRRSSFNSLSRDHIRPCLSPSGGRNLSTFNSLSRDHRA